MFWPILLCLVLLLPVWGQDPRSLTLGVHIDGELALEPIPPAVNLTPSADPQADGRMLLHRTGCIGCHDLDLPGYPHDRGPDLDRIGAKTHASWLDLWLRDPTAYLPRSRMPRIALGDSSRRHLVAWLAGLGHESRPDSVVPGDPYRGAQLFEGYQCLGCHAGGGEGGQIGPALDRIGWKTDAAWLQAALRDPVSQGIGAESHPYHLSERDIADLSHFLLRRFTPEGGPTSDVMQVTSALSAGPAAAIRHACFQCHRIEAFAGPRLRLPVARGRARTWLGYHEKARGPLPPIQLTSIETEAMVGALSTTSTEQNRTDARDFWQLPIPAQNPAPVLREAGRRLEPAACGRCHQQQLEEWQSTRHAGALSPGLRAQLLHGSDSFATECLGCHTPRQEQIDQWLDAGLEDHGPHGIDCAGCHVREHQYYGPGQPGRGRLVASVSDATHHGGSVVADSLFARSSFCAPCHQFETDGLSLQGKLLQNTYSEWSSSSAAADGRTCQDCHMPGASHRTLGLRDRDFVREALDFDVVWQQGAANDQLQVTLRNTGAGHAVPTYSTGALHVKVFLSDDHGAVIESSLRTRAVQRRLSIDGQTELFDTRIPPDGRWRFDEQFTPPEEARFVNVLVEVDPDHFYRRFFRLLTPPDEMTRMLLEQARGAISDSPYILFARQIEIQPQE